MTNHSLINASGRTHAKIAFLALAMSGLFVALVSASAVTKSDTLAARATVPVMKAGATMTIAATERGVVR